MIFTWNAFSVGANTVIDWLGEFNRAKVVTSLQSRNKDLEIFLDSQLKDEILNYRAKSDCLYNSLSQLLPEIDLDISIFSINLGQY